jgi:hypothetical protein
MTKDALEQGRRVAKANLQLMREREYEFDKLKNEFEYKRKVTQFLDSMNMQPLTDKQCSYINEVIYEKFMQAMTGEGCPSTLRKPRRNINKY